MEPLKIDVYGILSGNDTLFVQDIEGKIMCEYDFNRRDMELDRLKLMAEDLKVIGLYKSGLNDGTFLVCTGSYIIISNEQMELGLTDYTLDNGTKSFDKESNNAGWFRAGAYFINNDKVDIVLFDNKLKELHFEKILDKKQVTDFIKEHYNSLYESLNNIVF
jgi:hypothetical protein